MKGIHMGIPASTVILSEELFGFSEHVTGDGPQMANKTAPGKCKRPVGIVRSG